MVGDPVKLTPPPEEKHTPSPLLGEHTEEILKNIAGLSNNQISQLKENKII